MAAVGEHSIVSAGHENGRLYWVMENKVQADHRRERVVRRAVIYRIKNIDGRKVARDIHRSRGEGQSTVNQQIRRSARATKGVRGIQSGDH